VNAQTRRICLLFCISAARRQDHRVTLAKTGVRRIYWKIAIGKSRATATAGCARPLRC